MATALPKIAKRSATESTLATPGAAKPSGSRSPFNLARLIREISGRNTEQENEAESTWLPAIERTQWSKPAKFRPWTLDRLTTEVESAREKELFDEINMFYTESFSSCRRIVATFRSDTEPLLDWNFVEFAWSTLGTLPTDLQTGVLRSSISLLNKEKSKSNSVSRTLSLLVLLQNPCYRNIKSYVIFSQLLKMLADAAQRNFDLLIENLTKWSRKSFETMVSTIHKFITSRLFPARPQDLPPMDQCQEWVPSACRVLSTFNAANNRVLIVPFSRFYNHTLDHWDLSLDLESWESVEHRFSFCHYPFLLSLEAKRRLLESHTENTMINCARDEIIESLQRDSNSLVDMEALFLSIVIRRDHLLQDSLDQITSNQHMLHKKLRITFENEPGLDMGGLTKEWFQMLTRELFHPDYGMFVYNESVRLYWFCTSEKALDNLSEYQLIGALLGLALYNGVLIDVHFPPCCFKKLLSPPVLPTSHSSRVPLGVSPMTVDDLQDLMPDIARSLRELLDYEGDVEDDFGLTFQIGIEEYGAPRSVDLKANGDSVHVTNQNRQEFVALYVDYMLNRAVYRQFRAFYLGFHGVCSSNLMLMLRHEEIELLVCGKPSIDLQALKATTLYGGGFKPDDVTIRHFWALVQSLPRRHVRRLLLFVTGSERVPVGGYERLRFTITKMQGRGQLNEMLPVAQTCFNQLILPDYQSASKLRQKLAIALSHAEGFGLE